MMAHTGIMVNKGGQMPDTCVRKISKTWLWIGYGGDDRSGTCSLEILEDHVKF